MKAKHEHNMKIGLSEASHLKCLQVDFVSRSDIIKNITKSRNLSGSEANAAQDNLVTELLF